MAAIVMAIINNGKCFASQVFLMIRKIVIIKKNAEMLKHKGQRLRRAGSQLRFENIRNG